MDPVTHVLAAATAAEILAPSGIEPWAVAAAVGGGLAPDVDFAARRLGHLALLKFHHTLTHSLVGAAALAAAWAAVLWFIGRSPWLPLFGFAALGAATHLGFDLILHNNGLMLGWPLSGRMVRGGWVLGLNPLTSSARCGERKLTVCAVCQAHSLVFNRVFFTLVATAVAAAALWPWRRYVALAGWAALAAYLGYQLVLKIRAAALARAVLGAAAEVFPASFSGREWLAAAPAPSGYATATVDLKRRAVGEPRPHVPAPPNLRDGMAARPSVRAFLENAILPFAGFGPDGRSVWWQDLSYDFSSNVVLHTLKLERDDAGNVVGEEFRERW